MKNLKVLFDFTKLPVKFFFLFAVVTGLILFMSEEILSSIELTDIKTKYGWLIGLVFICSLSMVIINLIIGPYAYLKNTLKIKRLKKEFSLKLKLLDNYEKSVIREFYITGQSSIEMPANHPIIKKLIKDKILEIDKKNTKNSNLNSISMAISINKHAKKMLELNDIDLTLNPSEKDIKLTEENRPDFI